MTPPREPFFKPEDFNCGCIYAFCDHSGNGSALYAAGIANRLVEPLQKDLELSRKTNAELWRESQIFSRERDEAKAENERLRDILK